MTRTIANEDLGDAVNRLFQEVHDLKLRISSPDVVGIPANPSVDSLNIGGYVLDLEIDEVEPALGQPIGSPLLLTTGATIDDVFVDVEWLPPLDGSAVEYEVEMARETAPGVFGEVTFQRTGSTTVRFAGLEADTKYGFRVTAISRLGLRSNPSPLVHQTITTGADTGIPPAVTGVIIARGATTAVVKFTPLTYAQARDVAAGNGNYEVQIDTSNLFNTGNLRSTFTNDQIVAFSDLINVETWYARVRAIDKSNNTGPWSDVAGPSVAGGVIDAMIVADLDAAKITVGFLSASRLQADSITADKLTTSQLTTANIRLNGGSLTVGASPTVTGMVLNSQGLRAYKAGAIQFVLDATTGDATFSGNVSGASITGGTITGGTTITSPLFRTATSGVRIEININAGYYNRIRFFADVAEYEPAYIETNSAYFGEYGYIVLAGPQRYSTSRAPQVLIESSGSGSGGDISLVNCRNIVLGALDEITLASTYIYPNSIPSSAGASTQIMLNTGTFPNYLYKYTSSKRFKKDVVLLSEEIPTDIIFDFGYVAFTPQRPETGEDDGARTYGVLAEDIERACLEREVDPHLFVHYDENGDVLGFHYDRLAIPLAVELKKVYDTTKHLEKRLAKLEKSNK